VRGVQWSGKAKVQRARGVKVVVGGGVVPAAIQVKARSVRAQQARQPVCSVRLSGAAVLLSPAAQKLVRHLAVAQRAPTALHGRAGLERSRQCRSSRQAVGMRNTRPA